MPQQRPHETTRRNEPENRLTLLFPQYLLTHSVFNLLRVKPKNERKKIFHREIKKKKKVRRRVKIVSS